MPLVHHNFPDHKVSENTEILIIGTFHPEAEVAADFFTVAQETIYGACCLDVGINLH